MEPPPAEIVATLFAIPKSNEACIQVAAPFDVTVPLGRWTTEG